jgi:alpha-1,3-rhamnosyltransferase
MIFVEDQPRRPEAPYVTRVRVSVVVPSFNHAPFIETCLRSIFRQTHAPAELLVIDDGSTDNSPQIIERALRECPFPCEFLARRNRGLCATLNEGLERTSGDCFAYLGSDDVWLPEFLQARLALLEARPHAVLAYGHAYLIDEHDRIIDCTRDWAQYADGDARHMLLQAIAPMSPTVLYRRRALERHRWTEQARLEDYDLYLRLSVEGEFAFDPRVLSAWRQHSYNTSRDQVFMLDEQLKALRSAASRFGLGANELEWLQAALRFHRAEDFLRAGQKRAALGLMRHNLSGARSAREVARMFLRLVIPHRLMVWRRRLSQRRAATRYSGVEGWLNSELKPRPPGDHG